jgi:hypothetical protein
MLLVSQRRRGGVDTAWKRGFTGRLHQRRGQKRQTPAPLSTLDAVYLDGVSGVDTQRQQPGTPPAAGPHQSGLAAGLLHHLQSHRFALRLLLHLLLSTSHPVLRVLPNRGVCSDRLLLSGVSHGVAHITIYIANAPPRAWAQEDAA